MKICYKILFHVYKMLKWTFGENCRYLDSSKNYKEFFTFDPFQILNSLSYQWRWLSRKSNQFLIFTKSLMTDDTHKKKHINVNLRAFTLSRATQPWKNQLVEVYKIYYIMIYELQNSNIKQISIYTKNQHTLFLKEPSYRINSYHTKSYHFI